MSCLKRTCLRYENRELLSGADLNEIAIDSIYTPIKNVKYSVENYRVEPLRESCRAREPLPRCGWNRWRNLRATTEECDARRWVNIPSYKVLPGDVVAVREKSKSLEVIADALSGFNHSKYPWIEWDESIKGGKFLHVPQREDIPETIKEQLIVELYSK